MAVSRTAKLEAEIIKVKGKIAEQQGKLKELEHKRTEYEDMEIVDIVRGLRVPLDQLAAMLQTIGGTSGQLVPKLKPTKPETEQEDETE